MKKIALLLGSLMLIASLAGVADANHAWGKYHWNISTEQSLITPLLLGDNLSLGSWQSSLTGASSDWNESLVLNNQIASGDSNANCDPTLGRVEVCNGVYGQNGWLGIAQIWAYRGKDNHIRKV